MTYQPGNIPLDMTVIPAGSATISGANRAGKVVCPHDGKWTAIVVNVDTLTDAATVFTSYVNDATATSTFTLATASAKDTGHYIGPSAAINVRAGDLLEVLSDGGPTAGIGYFAFHIRKT